MQFMITFHEELARRRTTGPVDLREVLDHARAYVRPAIKAGTRRRARSERLAAELTDPLDAIRDRYDDPPTDLRGELDWAPFVLLGDPVHPGDPGSCP